jgi:iron complex outermembrane recepter protein
MKCHFPFAAGLALVLALHCPAFAAETGTAASPTRATGTITGRIQNVATGQYLNNARVSVRGTELVAFTDQSGTYVLPHVPSGAVALEVFFTGLDAQQISVEVGAGARVERNVDLTSTARYGPDAGAVKLDAYVVATQRETNNEAIAINEQRFAPNLKNVVAADALGDLMDGNVGEFLKFMPGITADYTSESGGSVASISVRGFPGNLAVVSSDGAEMANTGNAAGNSRVYEFSQVSINNVSRIEVTKVPTPASPADSMAGSVNMVTKSSFERRDAQLRYSISLNANHEDLTIGREPHANDERIRKILPSASFDYTLPVSRDFGLVLTGTTMNRFINQRRTRQTFTTNAAGTGASMARPFLSTLHFSNLPRVNNRHSGALRADWRVTRHGVLSVNIEGARYISDRSPQNINFGTGTNATPTPAGATSVPLSFGEDFTVGATGRGSVAILGDTAVVTQELTTVGTRARYRFDNGDWKIDGSIGASNSYGGYRDMSKGLFRMFAIGLINPSRVTFRNFNEAIPQSIEVFDNSNRPVDFRDLRNYRMTTANVQPRDIDDHMKNAKLDVRKAITFLPFPAAVQVGSSYREQTHDVRRYNLTWNFTPSDGDTTPTRFAMTNYVGRDDGFGLKNMPWVSSSKAWQAFQANPSLFTQTAAQVVASENARITNSEWLNEAVTAGYAQTELGLFRNRLRVLTGVRYETTTAQGKGPLVDPAAVWLRLPNGNFARTATGARIRRSEAGAVGSMQELLLVRQERAAEGERTYDGYYPSLHLTYQIADNFLARAVYAKTYGRPDFTNIVPNSTVDEADLDGDAADPTLVRGRINVRNTGLRPWTGDNYDLSFEYYTSQGGLFSIGGFYKEVRDFFGSRVKIATEDDLEALGLDPRYEGWQLTTQYNVPGTSTVKGIEFNIRQSLRALGGWGKYFQGFVNGTKLRLEGQRTADFSGFIPESANWGLTFSRRPINLMAKWNYRGKQQRGAIAAVDGFEYTTARITLDLNLEYAVLKNLTAYATASNVFNKYDTFPRYGPLTPGYARPFEMRGNGVQITAGVKGTF